jgi:disulfide bond formation protein DsbB
MTLPISYKQTNAILFLSPTLLLAFGYYLQFVDGLEPCPLCMTQRICFYLIGICAFIALFNKSSTLYKNITSIAGSFFAIVGLSVAGRQLWLQHLPEDQIPACGPDFNYIIDSFPILEAVEIMFKGNGNCAEVVWQFLGLSIPGWAFLAFLGFLGLNIIQLLRKI